MFIKSILLKKLITSHLFEEIIIVELELLLDNLNKYLVLKQLTNLSITSFDINRTYQKETPLSLFTFNFSDSYAQ